MKSFLGGDGEDFKKITARRATSKILRSLDSLMKDTKYKFRKGENPKFELNHKKLKSKISPPSKCDLTILF